MLNIFNYPHQLLGKLNLFEWLCNMLIYFMLVDKETVLNENRVRIHVRWTTRHLDHSRGSTRSQIMKNHKNLMTSSIMPFSEKRKLAVEPADFIKNVRQINSKSDLTSMSRFAGPSYLTVRSSLYIILI